jgi:hypothetical protein
MVLVLLHASMSLFLIADRRRVTEYDTKRYYDQQRAALSGSAGGGSSSGSLFQQVLLPFSRPLEEPTFLLLFHLGMFIDELIFLLGIWLLARSLFADPRCIFFVSVAALGSCLWTSSVWMNFRIFYALPVLIHLTRTFLLTGSPWTLAAALNLAALQGLGLPPGLWLLTPLAAALVLAGCALILNDPAIAASKSIAWNRRHLAAALAGLASWIPVGVLAGGQSGPRSWRMVGALDLVSGVALDASFTLFCGFLTLGFSILGLVRLPAAKSAALLAAAAATTLVVSLLAGTFAAGAPLLRLFVAFVSGFGFQAALERKPAPRGAAAILGAGGLLLAIGLLAVSSGIRDLPSSPPESLPPTCRLPVLRELLDTSALWAGVSGGLLLLVHSRARAVPLAIALILFLQPLEVFGWKFRMMWQTTTPVDSKRAVDQPPQGTQRGKGGTLAPLCGALLGLNALGWIGWSFWRAGRFLIRPAPGTGIG